MSFQGDASSGGSYKSGTMTITLHDGDQLTGNTSVLVFAPLGLQSNPAYATVMLTGGTGVFKGVTGSLNLSFINASGSFTVEGNGGVIAPSVAITLSFITRLTNAQDGLIGSGTLTPYGPAILTLTFGNPGFIFITLADGDTLDASIHSFNGGVDSGAGTAQLTGGTGIFKGVTGTITSFSFAFAMDQTVPFQGSGTLVPAPGTSGSSQTAGPGGAGYPSDGPGGAGYPVPPGPGGSGYVCTTAAGGASGEAPGGSSRGSNSGSIQLTACSVAEAFYLGITTAKYVVFNACGELTVVSGQDAGSLGLGPALQFTGGDSSGSAVLGSGGTQGGSSFSLNNGSASESPALSCGGGAGGGNSNAILVMQGAGGVSSASHPFQPHPLSSPVSRLAVSTGADSTPGTVLNISTPIVSADAAFAASASCPATPDSCWISIPSTAMNGSIPALSSVAIPVTVNQPGTDAGVYTAQVSMSIASGGTNETVSSPVTVVVPSPGQMLAVSHTGLQFQAVAGSAAALSQFVVVSNLGSQALPFTASASTLSGGNWLTVTPSSSSAAPAAPADLTVGVNPSGLAAGQYFGLVSLAANSAVNTPQAVEVVLTIFPAPAASNPTSNAVLLTPSTLQFAGVPSGNPASQNVTLVNLSSQTLTVTATPKFGAGTAAGWMTAAVASNSVAGGAL